ncbi:hypothetical protein [Streptosporangium sp. NPDC000239]|uniref:hypothetical protein n=1 Tax=unclassified Streptosporangium TaxID=2632669 RepID=UPI003330DFFE
MSTQLLAGSPSVPASVRSAASLWFIAVGTGAFESALAVADLLARGTASATGLAGGLGLRLAVFAGAILLAVRLRQGRGWARVALALTLGIFGTLSLVVEPVRWLMAGNSILGFFADADLMTLAFVLSRVVHLTAVLAAMALMFSPAANVYFRDVRSGLSPTPGETA